MKPIIALIGALAFLALLQVSSARASEEFKNLKVLSGADKKAVEKGMKSMSKGLGVKCTACHEKGKYESDKLENKAAGRTFLTSVVGEKEPTKRDAALATLLKALKLEKAKDPKAVWAGIDLLKKK